MVFKFDMTDAFEQVQQWVGEHAAIDETMQHAIEYCEGHCPDIVWRQARQLDFVENVEEIVQWLTKVFEEQPPPDWVSGLWFGLCNPFHGGKPTCMLYLAGSREFDAKDTKAMWVRDAEYLPLLTDQLWMAPSKVLQGLNGLAFGYPDHQGYFPDYANLLDYTLCLTFAGVVVLECCKRIDAKVWLAEKERLAIATGFDDGDFLFLGTMTKDGLVHG